MEKLDRGRLANNIKTAKTYSEWKDVIQKSGLKIVEHRQHLSKTTVQIWDIGLRPLFPVLIKMIQNIDKNKIIDIKKEWIEILYYFLKPIYNMDITSKSKEEPAFHYFVLEK